MGEPSRRPTDTLSLPEDDSLNPSSSSTKKSKSNLFFKTFARIFKRKSMGNRSTKEASVNRNQKGQYDFMTGSSPDRRSSLSHSDVNLSTGTSSQMSTTTTLSSDRRSSLSTSYMSSSTGALSKKSTATISSSKQRSSQSTSNLSSSSATSKKKPSTPVPPRNIYRQPQRYTLIYGPEGLPNITVPRTGRKNYCFCHRTPEDKRLCY